MGPAIRLFIAVLSLTLFAAVSAGTYDQAQVDSFLNAALACRQNKNPGLTVSVVKDGHLVFSKGYGVSDVTTGRPVTNQTLFGIASMSKAFAATLMVKLLHDRNMSLYTKPGDILPEGFAYNNSEFTQYATVRDLLSHCLGVPTHQGMRFDTNLTRKDAARRIRYFKPIYKFRLHYLYSNMHYGIISYLSEVLGGKTWEELIQEHIYTPLGMTDSDFLRTVDRSKRDVAQGYADDEYTDTLVPVPEEVNKLFGVYGGSTGIMSSSRDIAKWMLMQLGVGLNQHGDVVINESDLKSTRTPETTIRSSTVEKYFHRPMAPFTVTETSYAYGWKNGFYKGYKILRHTGTTFGYSSLVTLFPDMDLGIFTSMTGEDESYITRTLLHSYLADVFLGDDVTINKTTVCTYPEPWYPAAKHTPARPINKTIAAFRSLTEYVGVYHNVPYGQAMVSINTTVHQLQLDYGAGHWILYPTSHRDQFDAEAFGWFYRLWDLSRVRFHMHTNSEDTLEIASFEPHEPPIFVKHESHSGPVVG